MSKSNPKPRYDTDGAGYERFRDDDTRHTLVRVHQLVAIAYGADPSCVFSDGAFHVHHQNGCELDNRPQNLELIRQSDHASITFREE